MNDDITSAISNLSDKTEKLNIALYYTHENMEKAKKMISGAYKDLYAIKVILSSASIYGAFILYYNYEFFELIDSFYLISPDYSIINMNNQEEWKTFDLELDNARSKIQNTRALRDYKDKLDKYFTPTFAKNLTRYLEENDRLQLDHLFQKFLQESISISRIELSIEYQKISSLDMELNSKLTNKLSKQVLEKKVKSEEEKQKAAQTEVVDENAEPAVGKNGVKLILKGSLILSPIKGKHISQITQGDRIRLTLVDKSNQAIQVAKAFNAYDEENQRIKPIPARVKYIRFEDGVGSLIFAIVAKGILVRILEEETNIKIEMDPAYYLNKEKEVESKSKTIGFPLIITLAVIVLGLIAIIVSLVF